jgi:hypothetical protein
MIKNNVIFKWRSQENQYFSATKQAISEAPSLMSPKFYKYFNLYTFSSDRSYVVELTKKNDDNHEILISFMSFSFKGEELNYPGVYQKHFSIFEVVKHFRAYLLKSRTKFIVHYPTVRNLLV